MEKDCLSGLRIQGAQDRVLILDQEIRMETDPFAGLNLILDKEGEH